MADFVNPTTCAIVASVSDMPAPWQVCTREQLTQWQAIPWIYRKWVTDHVEEMTQAEKDAVDLAALTAQRNALAAKLGDVEDVLRAFMLVVIDGFNAHGNRTNGILTAIDLATTLADLKTRVGTITDQPTYTADGLRTAIRNKLGA